MDKPILASIIIIFVILVGAIGVMVFNFTNPKTSDVSNPIISINNQTTTNDTIQNNSNEFTSPQFGLTLFTFTSWAGNSQNTPNQVPNPGPTPDPMDHVISLFDAYVKSIFPQTEVPGTAIVLVQNDKIIYQSCLGVRDVASGAPVTPNTLFEIGSCTKAFTALNVAQLVDTGNMNWNDPITKYYPDPNEFQLYDNVTDKITIKDALLHISGLPAQGGTPFFACFNYTFSEDLYMMRYLVNDTPFRSKWQYNNVIYCLPGYAAAREENTTWSALIKKNLLEPLNMTTATSSYSDFLKTPDHITSYRISYNGSIYQTHWPDIDQVGPAGSIGASISDMTNWLKFQIADTGMFNGQQIISKAALDFTRTPQVNVSSTSQMGLGWVIMNDFIGFDGSTDSSETKVIVIPSKNIGMVVLTNQGPYGSAFHKSLYSKLVDLLNGNDNTNPWPQQKSKKDVETLLTPPDNPVPALPLSAYVGVYSNSFFGDIKIIQDNESLLCYYGNNTHSSELTHWNDSQFYDSYNYCFINFNDISNGTAHQLSSPNLEDNTDSNQTKTPALFNRTN